MNKIYKMADRTPFTYLIGWSSLRKYYYGVKFAKKCHPTDLFNTYFTSSKIVHNYIRMHGTPDIIQIRKTFNDINKARLYEYKVLTRLNVINRDDFLNNSFGKGIPPMPGVKNPFFGKIHTQETKNKISKRNKGRKLTDQQIASRRRSGNKHHMFGKRHTNDTIIKMRNKKLGKIIPAITFKLLNPDAYATLTNPIFLQNCKDTNRSASSIAKELNITADVVRKYTKSFGLIFDKNTEKPINSDIIKLLEDEQFLLKCITDGKTAPAVAKMLSISPTSVIRYAKKLDIKFPKKPISHNTYIKLSNKQFFIECKNQGLNYKKIANMLGDVSESFVGQCCRKLFDKL